MVQRKAARWIENKWQHFLSLTRMTRLMKLRSLEARRHIASLKLLFDVNNELKFVVQGTKQYVNAVQILNTNANMPE